MINVPQMTAMFTRMTPQQRKEHAQMHKNDPYTISLLMGIDAQEKALRTAMQGEGQAAQQPTVVDQGIEQMDAPPPQMAQALPENTGIGTLPQQPMQMAEGGIVAFGDGGDVQRFAGEGESLVRSTSGGKDWFLDVPETIRDPSVPYYRQIPNPLAALAGKTFGSREEAAQAYNSATTPAAPDALAAQSAMQASASSNADRGNFPGQGSTGMATPAPTQAPVAPPAAKTGIERLGAPAPAKAPRAAAGPTDLASQYKAIRGSMKDTDPYAAETGEIGEMGVKAAQERKAEREADIAKFDKAYEGREGRLDKREAEIGKQKDTNTGLAFLNAGLAIMSEPGGLAKAVGRGARVGTEQFAAGLDKIRAAQERLDDARDKAEDTKLRRDEMSAKEIRDANSAISSAQIDAKKLGIAGLRDAGAKNDKVAGSLFDATAKQQLEREAMASRERAATTTASAYSAGRLGLAEDRLTLDRQKAQLANLQKTLEGTSKHTAAGKLQRAQLERDMNTLRNQIAGGTMPAPSAVGAPGGPVIDFMTGKPI